MKTILVTGANGEIGHGLIARLAEHSDVRIIALDLHELDPSPCVQYPESYENDLSHRRQR
jgi:nucleoside-diphosphate-sugar epimerase